MNDKTLGSAFRGDLALPLGRIGGPSSEDHLLSGLQGDSSEMKCASVVALGLSGNKNNLHLSKALRQLVAHDEDPSVQSSALIALGRIGGKNNLVFLMSRPKERSFHCRSFAASAIAIPLSQHPEHPLKSEICASLLSSFKTTRNPQVQSSHAIALAQLSYHPAASIFSQVIKRGGAPAFCGKLCLSLGLLNYQPASKSHAPNCI
ncbi:MAG: HEAT repeat protein [Planctomycetota bacterium]|jgi:HEAT repeat protein